MLNICTHRECAKILMMRMMMMMMMVVVAAAAALVVHTVATVAVW